MKTAIRVIIALSAFCVSPEVGVFTIINLIFIHFIANAIRAGVERRKRAKQKPQRVERVVIEEKPVARNERRQEVDQERERKKQELEQARQRQREQKHAKAQSTIDFYENYLQEQKKILSALLAQKKMAEQLREIEKAEKLAGKILKARRDIFKTEQLLENAWFILEQTA